MMTTTMMMMIITRQCLAYLAVTRVRFPVKHWIFSCNVGGCWTRSSHAIQDNRVATVYALGDGGWSRYPGGGTSRYTLTWQLLSAYLTPKPIHWKIRALKFSETRIGLLPGTACCASATITPSPRLHIAVVFSWRDNNTRGLFTFSRSLIFVYKNQTNDHNIMTFSSNISVCVNVRASSSALRG